MIVAEYIKNLQSYEEYAFSWEEVLEKCNAPESTIRKELVRLAKKNEIVNLRKGFYIILPPKFQNLGKLPIQLYIDKLFKHTNKEYYIGLLTAANFHGAAHQKIQQDFIVTSPSTLRDVDNGNTKLRFIKNINWPQKNIITKKSDAGFFNLSSPALTIADLIHHQNKIGGLNRILANIEELIDTLEIEDLIELISWYPHVSTFQRMGYLFEYLEASEELIGCLENYLESQKYYYITLTPMKGLQVIDTIKKWKIEINITLENDL
jgi:predicted transcriptional regulator of viral defense system